MVGAITPWNFPLHQVVLKVAPALAAGCTVVLKPSEVAPINAFILAEIIDEVGLPTGVFNLVTASGQWSARPSRPTPGWTWCPSRARPGRASGSWSWRADTVKRVSLELGGKSANIILDDADLATAVPAGVFACYLNSGQTCSALTRMLVPREKLAEVEELARTAAEGFAPGDPFVAGRRLGPLVSSVQRDKVRDYIRKGRGGGGDASDRRRRGPVGLEKGFFVQPTVFSDVTRTMTIAREEIFGPVLSIIPFDTEEEAIEIANDTDYGLSGGVWAATRTRPWRSPRQLRTGQVDVNGGNFNPRAPFGGYKQSGIGRERGRFGLRGVPRDQGHAALRGFDVRPSGREFDQSKAPPPWCGSTGAGPVKTAGIPTFVGAGRPVRRPSPAPGAHRRQILTQTNRCR